MAPTREKTDLFPELTTRELEVAVLAWRALGEDGKVDVNKLAEVCNFGSVGSARVCWSTVRKKILTGDDGAASTVTAPKSKTGGSKGKTATAASKKRHATKAEDEEQAAEVAVPVKKPRGRKKKLPTAAVPQGANSNEDQDDEI